jgi:hydrogenase 3 maturation protease
MPDLREQLRQLFRDKVCLVGLGSEDYGDDGFGVRLAEELKDSEAASVHRSPHDSSVRSAMSIAKSQPTNKAQLGAAWCPAQPREPHVPLDTELGNISVGARDYIRAAPNGAVPPAFGSEMSELRVGAGTRVGTTQDPTAAANNGVSISGPRLSIIIAGKNPERFVSRVADEGFDHIIFIDAVEFDGVPGSVVLLDSEQMAARFPQVSTHRLSLGLLAKQIAANGRSKVWLLGVQPKSLKPGEPLSPNVESTLELLLELVRDVSQVGRAVPCAPKTTATADSPASRRAEDCAPYKASREVLA